MALRCTRRVSWAVRDRSQGKIFAFSTFKPLEGLQEEEPTHRAAQNERAKERLRAEDTISHPLSRGILAGRLYFETRVALNDPNNTHSACEPWRPPEA